MKLTARRITAALAAAVALPIGASATPAAGAGSKSPAAPRGSITVFAASSLTEAFNQVGASFERQNRGVHVSFNYGASSTLAAQIQQSAPADVFASADQPTMARVVQSRDVSGKPANFAGNLLEIAVAPGNPKHVRTLADTLQPGVSLVLCAPQVACGAFALQAYRKAALTVPTVPTGLNVKDTLSKVSLGQADAAVVYVTDVRAAKGQVAGVPIPTAQNVRAEYPIAVVRSTANAGVARAFQRFVLSASGQAILRRFGFLAP